MTDELFVRQISKHYGPVLNMIVIYDKPKDYPDKYVARLFLGEVPTLTSVVKDNINEIYKLIPVQYIPLNRFADDDPVIKETWIY